MFALVFANQVFAAESEVVVADETTKSETVVVDETTKAEAAVVYDKLKTDGLTDAQIVAAVEEKLRNETTENAYRSTLDKHNQDKIVWALVGAAATLGVIYGVIPGVKWAYGKYKSAKPEVDIKDKAEIQDKTGDDKDKRTVEAGTLDSSVASSGSGSASGLDNSLLTSAIDSSTAAPAPVPLSDK